jgi:AhpD family alkylhydroperoxidase
MEARMRNPAMLIPNALEALLALSKATEQGGVPPHTLGLVALRASQINGCSLCVDMHPRMMKKAGETDQRILALAAWRDTTFYTDGERAALALTEALTRLPDRSDPVPDAIWNEAARHFDERGMAALVLAIGVINVFNRINVAVRQPAGSGPM